MPASTSDIALDTLDASKKEDDLLEDKGEKREIGGEAVWTLSTAKPGNGVEQLSDNGGARRDNNTETYWQSDGPQPHLVNIQFHKKVRCPSTSPDRLPVSARTQSTEMGCEGREQEVET
eukprot:977862-Rhodomonas_salina.1